MPIIGSGVDNITHFGGIRVRVNGTGSLICKWKGYDDASEYVMRPLPMSPTPGRVLERISNFQSQRAQLELKTEVINEYMRVNRIVLWVKEVASSYPGNY